MDKNITLESTYQVYARSQLNMLDFEVLIALYQPILGHASTNLFLTLWSEAKINANSEIINNIKRIIKVMNIDLRSLTSHFSILEAVGLVKTYYNKDDNNYIFALIAPDKPSDFFKNPLLVTKLLDCLQERDFLITKQNFKTKKVDLQDYENISKTYKEVFSLSCSTNQISIDEDIPISEKAVIESDLDINIIKDALKQYNLQYFLLENKVVQTLEMLYLTYAITTDELVKAIIDVVDDGDSLNLDELVETIKLVDKLKKTPSRLEMIYLRNNDGSTLYEKYSVKDFLEKNYAHLRLSEAMFLKLEYLMKEYKFSNGIMNIMIEITIKRTETLNISYLEAVAKEWSGLKIDNITKAIEKAKMIDNYDKGKKPNYYKQRTIGSTKDWNQVDDRKLTSEEVSEMEDILKKMKGE